MSGLLADLVITSLTVVIPGLYFVALVESTDGLKAYRYRFLQRDGILESINNVVTVGIVGYTLFLFSLPAMNVFFGSVFGNTVNTAVEALSPSLQLLSLILLTGVNMILAYLGLRK